MSDLDFPVDTKIPKGSLLDKIESSYGPLESSVRCGLLGCGQMHQKGFVVSFRKDADSELERALMGHVCGKREFGAGWAQALVLHEAEVRAADIRAELDRFLPVAATVEPRLRELLPWLEVRSTIRQILLIDARDFMRHCADACRNGSGQLRQYGYSDKPKRHTLTGPLFFLQDTAWEKAKRLLQGIVQISRLAEQPDTTTRQLRDFLSRVGNLRLTLDEIEKEAAAGSEALRPANFAKAIHVLDPYETGSVRVTGTVLEVRRSLGNDVWSQVADLANPRLPARAYPWSKY